MIDQCRRQFALGLLGASAALPIALTARRSFSQIERARTAVADQLGNAEGLLKQTIAAKIPLELTFVDRIVAEEFESRLTIVKNLFPLTTEQVTEFVRADKKDLAILLVSGKKTGKKTGSATISTNRQKKRGQSKKTGSKKTGSATIYTNRKT